jgi:hypothetical protein
MLQVKKRARWLNRFSLDVLSKLPGTTADPFDGVTIDTNGLGAVKQSSALCYAAVFSFGWLKLHRTASVHIRRSLLELAAVHNAQHCCQLAADNRCLGGS